MDQSRGDSESGTRWSASMPAVRFATPPPSSDTEAECCCEWRSCCYCNFPCSDEAHNGSSDVSTNGSYISAQTPYVVRTPRFGDAEWQYPQLQPQQHPYQQQLPHQQPPTESQEHRARLGALTADFAALQSSATQDTKELSSTTGIPSLTRRLIATWGLDPRTAAWREAHGSLERELGSRRARVAHQIVGVRAVAAELAECRARGRLAGLNERLGAAGEEREEDEERRELEERRARGRERRVWTA